MKSWSWWFYGSPIRFFFAVANAAAYMSLAQHSSVTGTIFWAVLSCGVNYIIELFEDRRVQYPLASWLLSISDNVCRKATAKLIGQMVADMRVEHYDALREGRKFKAQWITILHYISIARALTLDRLLTALLDYALGVFRAGKS
jgi:hypothetical protein